MMKTVIRLKFYTMAIDASWKTWAYGFITMTIDKSSQTFACTVLRHFRPKSPRSFWTAPGMETSGRLQHRKSVIHGLTVKSDKSDWLAHKE